MVHIIDIDRSKAFGRRLILAELAVYTSLRGPRLLSDIIAYQKYRKDMSNSILSCLDTDIGFDGYSFLNHTEILWIGFDVAIFEISCFHSELIITPSVRKKVPGTAVCRVFVYFNYAMYMQ